jgi:hypothetical protein
MLEVAVLTTRSMVLCFSWHINIIRIECIILFHSLVFSPTHFHSPPLTSTHFHSLSLTFTHFHALSLTSAHGLPLSSLVKQSNKSQQLQQHHRLRRSDSTIRLQHVERQPEPRAVRPEAQPADVAHKRNFCIDESSRWGEARSGRLE